MKQILLLTLLLSSSLSFSQSLECIMSSDSGTVSTTIDLSASHADPVQSIQDKGGDSLHIVTAQTWKNPRTQTNRATNLGDFRSVSISIVSEKNDETLVDEFTYNCYQNGEMLPETKINGKSVTCTSNW